MTIFFFNKTNFEILTSHEHLFKNVLIRVCLPLQAKCLISNNGVNSYAKQFHTEIHA